MKDSISPDNDDKLSEMLGHWVIDAPLPPRFQEQVWRRIARAETTTPVSIWMAALNSTWEAFTRPKIAFAYVAILVGAGIAAGFFAAETATTRIETELRARYVQFLDPYQIADSRP